MEIFFHKDRRVFGYRVAGILIRDGKVLLQKHLDDDGLAFFPGGHVEFGETGEQALVREFREELSTDIRVGPLRWVGEMFYLWSGTAFPKSACIMTSPCWMKASSLRTGVFL